MDKVISVILLNLLFFSNLAYANQTLVQECELTLGWGEWPPYQTSVNPEEPFGIQIDLVKQIARNADCSIKFKKNTFEENLSAVKSGEVDFIMDTSITEERKSFGYFSDPYRLEVLALYVKPEFSAQCNNSTFERLIKSGVRIGMNRGNIYGKEIADVQLNEHLDKKLVYAPNHESLYQMFHDKKIDGFFDDPTVLAYKLRLANRSGQLVLCKISQNSSTVSFLFSKKATSIDIVERFNKALKKVKKTTEYQANWGW